MLNSGKVCMRFLGSVLDAFYFIAGLQQSANLDGEKFRRSYPKEKDKDRDEFLNKLPKKRKAVFINIDGQRNCYDVYLKHNGEPQEELKISKHVDKFSVLTFYKFWKKDKNYLFYVED